MDRLNPTKLDYFDDMKMLTSETKILYFGEVDGNRTFLILESTIFHPQGGGQPCDAGFISDLENDFKFIVEDVRLKDGLVYHYGCFDAFQEGYREKLHEGQKVLLHVNGTRRELNSRLHSAGHLLDTCMRNVGLSHLEPTKGYHFPDGPFVEYKGTIPSEELGRKQDDLEKEANKLISKGGKVSAAIYSYDEAAELCGGQLPSYIPKGSIRIVKLGDNPGCPCGGTHVAEISAIKSLRVSQIRTKKGHTKVFYTLDP